MKLAVAAFSGALFGVGLAISGMGDPARVFAFLDVTSGAWDPSLAFVMGGALVVYALAWRFVRTKKPLLEERVHLPDERRITQQLVAGAAIFGIGWGLLGYCPGPALLSVGRGAEPLLFVFAMISGSVIVTHVKRLIPAAKGETSPEWTTSSR